MFYLKCSQYLDHCNVVSWFYHGFFIWYTYVQQPTYSES